ncbi:unnamed protein product [Amoebophrya sp. A25]|nr:unnamed protein product [Amoebophrya sp. A25]|eukprot:GSA25T00019337001.1
MVLLLGPADGTEKMRTYVWSDGGEGEQSVRLRIIDRLLIPYETLGLARRLLTNSIGWSSVARIDLLRAHSQDIVDALLGFARGPEEGRQEEEFGAKMLSATQKDQIDMLLNSAPLEDEDPEGHRDFLKNVCRARLTAVSTVLALADSVLPLARDERPVDREGREAPGVEEVEHAASRDHSSSAAKEQLQLSNIAFAATVFAGHHAKFDKLGVSSGANTVMVAALKYAASGYTVGIYDIDVHFAGGSQDIAFRWNKNNSENDSKNNASGPRRGKVYLSDVYAAFFDKTVMGVRDIARHERAVKFGSASRQAGRELDGHLFFDHWPEDFTDEALTSNTHDTITHFRDTLKVDIVFVFLGLDAAKGDLFSAQVTPRGFEAACALLREQLSGASIPCVFALGGGYRVTPEAGCEDTDDVGTTSVFGKCIQGALKGLCTATAC